MDSKECQWIDVGASGNSILVVLVFLVKWNIWTSPGNDCEGGNLKSEGKYELSCRRVKEWVNYGNTVCLVGVAFRVLLS